MKLYMLIMEGQGDTHVKLVTEAIWNWIFSGSMEGRPADHNGWYDPTTPDSVRQAANGMVFVTTGSLDNDRAIEARGDDVPFDEYGDTDAIEAAREWATQHGHKIVNTWEGCIY